jgi:hypothetical protein
MSDHFWTLFFQNIVPIGSLIGIVGTVVVTIINAWFSRASAIAMESKMDENTSLTARAATDAQAAKHAAAESKQESADVKRITNGRMEQLIEEARQAAYLKGAVDGAAKERAAAEERLKNAQTVHLQIDPPSPGDSGVIR